MSGPAECIVLRTAWLTRSLLVHCSLSSHHGDNGDIGDIFFCTYAEEEEEGIEPSVGEQQQPSHLDRCEDQHTPTRFPIGSLLLASAKVDISMAGPTIDTDGGGVVQVDDWLLGLFW